jgi:hypothetical protein
LHTVVNSATLKDETLQISLKKKLVYSELSQTSQYDKKIKKNRIKTKSK